MLYQIVKKMIKNIVYKARLFPFCFSLFQVAVCLIYSLRFSNSLIVRDDDLFEFVFVSAYKIIRTLRIVEG